MTTEKSPHTRSGSGRRLIDVEVIWWGGWRTDTVTRDIHYANRRYEDLKKQGLYPRIMLGPNKIRHTLEEEDFRI